LTKLEKTETAGKGFKVQASHRTICKQIIIPYASKVSPF